MRWAWVLIAIAATGCGGTATQTNGPPISFAPNRGQFADRHVPAGRRPGADVVGNREAQASGGEIPRSDSGREPKIRRSLSLIATSLMLASRRRM
jgi:hypothetical protein